MEEQWQKDERREGYCPVHHIKCEDMKKLESGLEKKVPIWVFKLSITVLILALGGMNAYFYRLSTETLKAVQAHVDVSSKILKRMSLKSREATLNQKIIMEKLDLPYREIPRYYGNGENRE